MPEYIRVHWHEVADWERAGWALVAAEGYADGSESSALLVRQGASASDEVLRSSGEALASASPRIGRFQRRAAEKKAAAEATPEAPLETACVEGRNRG